MQYFIKKFSKFGTIETLLGRGRKRKLSVKTMRKLYSDVNNNPWLLKNVAEQLDPMGVSAQYSDVWIEIASMVADLNELPA